MISYDGKRFGPILVKDYITNKSIYLEQGWINGGKLLLVLWILNEVLKLLWNFFEFASYIKH